MKVLQTFVLKNYKSFIKKIKGKLINLFKISWVSGTKQIKKIKWNEQPFILLYLNYNFVKIFFILFYWSIASNKDNKSLYSHVNV